MWWKIFLSIIALFVIVLLVLVFIGSRKWESRSKELLARMEKTRKPKTGSRYDPALIKDLPEPVKRYFEKVLPPGQPYIESVYLEHEGTFNMSQDGDDWKPFTSKQYVSASEPGFLWDARIKMGPEMKVHVHDAFINGEGILTGKIFGLIPVMDMTGTPGISEGEFMRWLAETAWYPTALLPGGIVTWRENDETSAIASAQVGEIKVDMIVYFNDDDLIDHIRIENRGMASGDKVIPTPWEGRWKNYRKTDGILVPAEGEVSWVIDEVKKPYWRGTIKKSEYSFAR